MLKRIGRRVHAKNESRKNASATTYSSGSSSAVETSEGNDALQAGEVAYLAESTRQYVASLDSEVGSSWGDNMIEIEAAVLFVDISGFTKRGKDLSNMLTATTAAEEFAWECISTLNAWALICTRWGGDVVKFAGDALVCLWPVEPAGDLATVSRRASRAALEMLRHFRRTEPENSSLDIHGGLGLGHVTQVFLCNEDHSMRWSHLQGTALGDASQLLSESNRGEILVAYGKNYKQSPKAWAITGNSTTRGNIDLFQQEPYPQNQLKSMHEYLDTLDPVITRSFIPKLVRGRLQGFRPEDGEMRQVTVMFAGISRADLQNFDMNALNGDLKFLNKTFFNALTLVHAAGGEIRDMLVDDKGLTFIALWGAYKRVENAQLLAVRTATELQKATPNTSIGISSGVAFAGLCGHSSRHDFVVFGHQVNMASRLMEAAKHNEIVVGFEILQELSEHYKFNERKFSRQKQGYVETYRGFVVGSKISRKRRSTVRTNHRQLFIGRSSEIALIQQFIERVEKASGLGLINLKGDEQVGKTALARQVRQVLAFPSVKIMASRLEQDTEMFVASQLVENLGGTMPCEDDAASFDQWIEMVADTVAVLLKEKQEDKALTVLVIEDACWIDASSAAVMTALIKKGTGLKNVVVLAEFRDLGFESSSNSSSESEVMGYWNNCVLNVADDPKNFVLNIHLYPMSRREVEELATSLFQEYFRRLSVPSSKLIAQPTIVEPQVLELIYNKSFGLPANVRETTKWLYDKKVVSNKDGFICHASEVKLLQADMHSPSSFKDGILRKFDELLPTEQSIVKIAACLVSVSLDFNAYVVALAMGCSVEDLDAFFQSLVRHGFIRKSSSLKRASLRRLREAISSRGHHAPHSKSLKNHYYFTSNALHQCVLSLVPSSARNEIRNAVRDSS